MRLLVVIALWASISSQAAEVLEVGANPRQVAITQSQDTRSFVPRDYLCIWHGDEEVACGIVIEVLPKGAIMRLDYAKETIRKGDPVYFAGSRYPAFAARAEDAVIEAEASPKPWKRKYPFDLTAGFILSPNYSFPMVHFQGMVASHWSLGLQGQYVSQNTSAAQAKAYSGMLTVNYYGSRYYRGVWLQVGAGLFFFSRLTGPSPTTTAAAGLGTLGYRLGIWRGLNLGLSIGAQYIQKPVATGLTFDHKPWQAVGTADLGLNF